MNDPATVSAESPLKPALRIWPALLLVVALWIFKLLPGFLEETTFAIFTASIIAPLVCAFLILVWWCGFSRAEASERAIGLIAALTIALFSSVFVDKSLKGLGLLILVLPWGFTAFAVGAIISFRLRPEIRIRVVVAATLIGFGLGNLVRSDGVWGDFRPSLSWRWTPSPEELFMESLKTRKKNEELQEIPTADFSDVPWPSFRGANRDAVVSGIAIEENWQQNPPRELWRIPCGPAWSSFTVAGNRLFTQEQRGDNEAVVCYDAETGSEIWASEYGVRFWEALAGAGPRATPTIHEGKIYALGAEGLLKRIDAVTGLTEWNCDLKFYSELPKWGFSSSPLVHQDCVIVHVGGEGDDGILAFDKDSGDKKWSAACGQNSYSSPQLMQVNDQTQLMMVSNSGLSAYDPVTGNLLWEHTWEQDGYRILQPLQVDGSSFIIGNGWGIGSRRIDVSFDGEQPEITERWTSRNIKPDHNDFVAHNGHLYGFDRKIFTSIDLETGERNWKKGRYGHGQVLLLPNQDQLLILSETGDLVLLRATPERHEELASIPAIGGKTWNHPVLVNDRLYVRNDEEAACFQMPLKPQDSPQL